MTTLRPYLAYRDSGVDWLGQIPAHWDVVALRYKYSVQLGKMLDSKRITGEHLTPYLRNVDVRWGHVALDDLPLMDITPSEFERYTVKPGDLLVCEGGEVGRSAIWRHDESVGFQKALHRLRPLTPATDTSEYFYYVMLATAQRGIFAGQGNENTFNHLTGEAFRAYRFAFPPLDEQRAIAAFLDAMDARITRFIAARKKMIRLLEEKKQAVINQAVTKGLDPTVPMKDSGVEWLGEIPAHWETPKIGHFASVGNGSTPSRGELRYWTSEGFPWLNSSSVHQGVVESTDQFVTEVALNECHLPIVRPGDLLVAITGQGKTRGTAAIVSMTATINQHMAYISIRKPWVGSRFLQLVLTGAYAYLREISSDSGSTKGALTCADIQHFKIPMPPVSEQEATVDVVDRELSQIDQITKRSLREIELMQEYRTRLISDVVTGKLDVRGVDLGELPEFEEVPEPGENSEVLGYSERLGVDERPIATDV